MPYVEGKSLGDVRQENGPFLEQDLVNILTDILDALNFLHQRQRIHRDIKPENILLTSDLKPMLLDFGTVRELNSANPFTKIGTPKYAPFEQMQTNGEIGPWSDLYSLGATMYDLVAGEPPIPSINRITVDADPYVPLSRRPECLALYSPQLLQTIDHALISDHRQRYQNAQEWLNALKPTPVTTSEPTKTASSIGESLPDGYVLNGYTIIKTIGQGGFGITYLAEDNDLHYKVVIKENFPTEFVHRDAEYQVQTRLTQKKTEVSFDWYLNNFRHEAELLANLNHPNIVRVLQFFNANGTSYYVMPYIEGISLSEFRDTYGAPNEEWLVDFLKRMLSALDYIHSHNLLHRDI